MSARDDLDNNPFITRIDIDNLTTAIRALSMQIVQANDLQRGTLDAQRRQLELQRSQTDLQREQNAIMSSLHEEVVALREAIVQQKSNGALGIRELLAGG